MQILTKLGLIERTELEVKDVIVEEENARVTATEWYHNGELVRRDVNVNILSGIQMTGEQQTV